MFNFFHSNITKIKIIPFYNAKSIQDHDKTETNEMTITEQINSISLFECCKNFNIGLSDPILLGIDKDIKNHLILNKYQLTHLKKCSKTALIKIIKLYDTVKDVKNHLILNKYQITLTRLKKYSKNELIGIIKSLNYI